MVAHAHIRTKTDLGPLHDLLLRACPADPKTGAISITVLARMLEISTVAIYAWIKRNKLSPFQAERIVKLHHEEAESRQSRGVVTMQDFSPFLSK